MKHETIKKILEMNTVSNFSDIGHSNIFLGMSPQAKEAKAKLNYQYYIKIKSFFAVKETINKIKRKPIEQQNIFASDISDKGLISNI